MSVQLRYLAYFESVARLGSFDMAALEHDLSSLAFRTRVSELERIVGRPLVGSTQNHVTLTALGREVSQQLQAVVADIEVLRARPEAPSEKGCLAIGLTATLGTIDIRRAVTFLRGQHPDITLRIATGLLTVLLDKLDSGEIDFIVGPLHPAIVKTYGCVPLSRDRLVLALPASRPRAASTITTLGDVTKRSWATLPPGTGIRSILESQADTHRFDPRIRYEVGPLQARSLVASGRVVALLPMSVVRAHGPPIAVAQLSHHLPYPPIGIVYSRDRPLRYPARIYIDHLRRHHQRSAPAATEGGTLGDHKVLTPREAEVMQLVKEGLTTRLAAKRLGLRPRTVDKHVERALRKLGARSRIEALAILRRHVDEPFP